MDAEFLVERQRDEVGHTARVSMLGQLASSLAHELRQPLGAILRNAEAAELILRDSPPDLAELRAVIADIRGDASRAGSVIDRMRSLVRRRDVERRTLDLAALAREVVDLVRPDADTRHVRIALEHGPPLPPVRGDRVQLEQVVLNLVLNALEAAGGRAASDRRVTLRARASGGGVELAVVDNGPGISESAMPRLFEPFWSTRADGLGMGLAISLAIIEAHGGRLWAENNEGGGARFTFSLPPADGEAAA